MLDFALREQIKRVIVRCLMESEARQLLRSQDIEPTHEVLSDALGEAYVAYRSFVDLLDKYDVHYEWRYYSDGKAWLAKGIFKWTGKRGGKKESTVFWLSIWSNYFKVTFYIHEKDRKDAVQLPIDDKVRQMIQDSKQMGKTLKYFPVVLNVASDACFSSLIELIEFKKRTT